MMATHWTADAIIFTPTGLKTDVKKMFESVLKAGFDHAEVMPVRRDPQTGREIEATRPRTDGLSQVASKTPLFENW